MSHRPLPLLSLLSLLVILAVFVARAWGALDSVVDDAWISARYARNLALGHGFVYNAGEPPIEGYTNLGFVVLLAGAYRLGIDMHTAMISLGLIFGALALVGVHQLAQRLSGVASPWNLIPAAWLALDPHFAVVSTNGIESSMFIAAVVWGAVAALHEENRLWSGFAVAALIVTRPEGIAVACAIAGYELLFRGGKAALPSLLGSLGVGLAVWGGRYLYFGQWVPNTFSAKDHRDLAAQITFNLKYLTPDAYFWVAAAVIALLGLRLQKERGLVLALGLGLTAVAFRVDMWMPGGRLLLPAVALGLTLGGSQLAAFAVLHRAVAVGGGLLAVGFAALLVTGPIPKHVFKYDSIHSALPHNGAQSAAEHLAQHLPPGSVMATRDAGVLAYFVGPEVRVAELHDRALTQPHPNGEDADIFSYTPENPEAFLSTVRTDKQAKLEYPNDKRIWKRMTANYDYLGRVHQHHRRYYDVYVRSDLNVPPLPKKLVVSRAGPKPEKK